MHYSQNLSSHHFLGYKSCFTHICLILCVYDHSVADFRLSKMSYNSYNNGETDDILLACNEIRSYKGQYKIFQKRLQLLQKYIPTNYSSKFRNPCWYDFHPTPNSQDSREMYLLHKEKFKQVIGSCDTPLSYSPSLAKNVLEQAAEISSKKQLHCLPSFFLSGFPKCASTALYTMIVQHPQIAQPRCRETHFWAQFVSQKGSDLDKELQILQYLSYFSPSIDTIKSNHRNIALDASVTYHIWNSESDYCVLPTLLMRVLPETKFIVIMRNPSDRVFSHYFYYLRREYASATKYLAYVNSSAALEVFHYHACDVIKRFQSCMDSGHSTSSCVRSKTIDGKTTQRNGHVGLQNSMYYYHIVPWLNIFPRERFLFLRTEDLAHNQSLTMSKVWHFLELEDFSKTKEVFAKVNKHATVPLHTRELLDTFFQPHNELLANLLSDSIFLWKD